MRHGVETVLPSGEVKLVDGYPFNLASVPPGTKRVWAYGYCAAISSASFVRGQAGFGLLWNAGVSVTYAADCLRAGLKPEQIVHAWESGISLEFASAL